MVPQKRNQKAMQGVLNPVTILYRGQVLLNVPHVLTMQALYTVGPITRKMNILCYTKLYIETIEVEIPLG